MLLPSVFSLMSGQPHVSPSAAHTLSGGGFFKLPHPLVIHIIITIGLDFPCRKSSPKRVHFQPLRSSGPLN